MKAGSRVGPGVYAWGAATGAALAGWFGWDAGEAVEAALLALAVGCLVQVARRGLGGVLGRIRRLRGRRSSVLPPWPPPGWEGGLAGGSPTGRLLGWAARPWAPRPGRSGWQRSGAHFGLALLAGACLAGRVLEAEQSGMRALQLPRLVWVGGYPDAPWEQGPWAASVRLVGARVFQGRCGPAESGRALPGGVRVEAPLRVARRRPVLGPSWVCVRGVLQVPDEAAVPGAFSARRYWRARGVVARVAVRAPGRVEVMERAFTQVPPAVALRMAAALAARRIAASARRRLGQPASEWFEAVALGEARELGPQHLAALQETGLRHLLSVSGLHVGLLAVPLALASRLLPPRSVGRPLLVVAGAASGWLYAAATGMASPAVRAVVLQALGAAAALAARRRALLPALGWAAFAQLASNPGLAVDPGFQLSYAATAGIALAAGRGEAGTGLEGGGPAPEARPGSWPGRGSPPGQDAMARRVRSVGSRVGAALAVSAGAWAVSGPLVALYYGWASPWGIVLSPLASLPALVLLWGGFLAGWLPDPLALVAAVPARAAAAALEGLTGHGSQLAERWSLLIPREAWFAACAVGAAGMILAGRVEMVRRRPLLLAAALAAVLVWEGGRLAGDPVVAGQALHPGWVLVLRDSGAAWAAVGLSGQAVPDRLAARARSAMAAAGVHRLAAVVVLGGDRQAADGVVKALGAPAGRAAVVRLDPRGPVLVAEAAGQGTWQAEAARLSTTVLRALPERTGSGRQGRQPGGLPMPGLWVRMGGVEPVEFLLDGLGCLHMGGWPKPLCVTKGGLWLRRGLGGWEVLP